MLPPLPHGIFAPEGDLGTAHDWEVRNLQGRGSLVHRLRGGKLLGLIKGMLPPGVAAGSAPSLLGSLPTGLGCAKGALPLHSPCWMSPRAAATGARGLVRATVQIPWEPEGISSVVIYEQQHTTPQHRDTDMLPGHTRAGGGHSHARASAAARSQPAGRAGSGTGTGAGRRGEFAMG